MTVAVISGASRGMGFAAAVRLAREGAVVFAGARKPNDLARRLDAMPDLDMRPVELDVTSEESVARAAERIGGEVAAIDVLVNNAGIPGSFGTPDEITPDDFRGVLETNLLGPVRLTHALLPLLRRGSDPRLVMVSSGMGSLTLQSTDEVYRDIAHLPYPATKAALNMLAVQYAKALPDVIVTTVDPGLTATEFTGNHGHSVEDGSEVIVRAALDTTAPSGRFIDRHGVQPW